VELIKTRQKIVVLTGAGISVSCGIPDFRSPGGFYETVGKAGIDPPEQVFDLAVFRENPSLFYRFGGEIDPLRFVPSITHRFLAKLDSTGRLLRNYTQNIDTLEAKVRSILLRLSTLIFLFPSLLLTRLALKGLYIATAKWVKRIVSNATMSCRTQRLIRICSEKRYATAPSAQITQE
jgi:hypothetical protein